MSRVNLSDLIDEIDHEDKISNVSKSILKKRLESISKTTKLLPYGTVAHKTLERQAAYNLASKDISDWQDTIISNRTARQVDLTKEAAPPITLEQLIKDSKPEGLTKEINGALQISENLTQTEPENSGAKSKLRSEMFYQYQKQKRIAKIKSKLYHKIRNRNREKGNEAAMDEEQKIENENLMRIEERIGLRHSAKRMKKTLGKYARDESKKLISENEALRQRIRNPSRVSSDGKVVYDSSSDDEMFLADQLQYEIEEESNKGVMGMKFMKEAVKRQREKEEALTQGLLRDLNAETSKLKFEGEPKKRKKIEKSLKTAEQEKFIDQAFEMNEMDKIAAEEWEKEVKEKEEKKPKTLKGWGSWCGNDIRQKNVSEPIKTFKVDKIIINEERDKRAAKFLVKQLPFPYNSSRQFDSVHKVPIGKEWNSKRVYQKQIAPDILTRDGEIIDPISK